MSCLEGYVLGLDGGGTKVEAVLLDASGAVKAAGKGGATNTTFVSDAVARKSIEDAIEGATSQLGGIEVVCTVGLCLVGGRSQAEMLLQGLGYAGPVFSAGEFDVAFRRAGLLHTTGIAVIAGTGSSFRARNSRNETKSIGGWGIAVGDEGSGFDIGLRALKAAGRSLDGRGPHTVLADMVVKHTNAPGFQGVLKMYCRPSLKQREIAALSRLVSEAASGGDKIACEIMTAAGKSLGEDTAFLARQMFHKDETFDVVYSGGVFSAGEMVIRPLEECVRSEFPHVKFHLPQMSAGEAVARLAYERAASD